MKINEIIEMPVNPNSKTVANGDQVDPKLIQIRKEKQDIEDGIDTDLEEILQDFPA